MSVKISYMPARELISGDVLMFDDGSEGEVTAADFGDPETFGMVTLAGKLALPWMVSVFGVERPVITHPAQMFKVRRATSVQPSDCSQPSHPMIYILQHTNRPC